MTDAADYKSDPSGERIPDDAEIIDASARTRPRVHTSEAEKSKAIGELSFLGDIPLRLNMVLGEATMPLGEIIALETDSIVQLDKPSGEPIDIYVENQKLGTGEVIVLHEKLRIRVLEVTSPSRESKKSEAQQLEKQGEE